MSKSSDFYTTKGQLISKANCQAKDSSKKRTNEFVFTSMRRVFVRFFEESSARKKTFRDYLTFMNLRKIIDLEHLPSSSESVSGGFLSSGIKLDAIFKVFYRFLYQYNQLISLKSDLHLTTSHQFWWNSDEILFWSDLIFIFWCNTSFWMVL